VVAKQRAGAIDISKISPISENDRMIVVVSLLASVVWIYLVGFHGRFWRALPELDAARPAGNAKLTVIVPARNEAESIGQSLRSLLAQDYCEEFSIVLVDDNSTDGTGEIVASLGAGPRLTIVAGEPLPPGWSGKLWAVHQGLAHERASAADYVLLTDADIVHAPDHISALVAKAENDELDLVSEMVRLHCATAAERSLVPAFVFFFQMLYPFAWVADPAKRVGGAAGGTMLVSRAALGRIDGVSRIRHHLIDDCALAKQIKSTGGKIWLGHTERAVSIRVYSKWRDVWDMIARTAYVQLGYSPLMLMGCAAGMVLMYCAPPLLALFAHGLPRVLGLFCWATMALAFLPTLHRYRLSPLRGVALPCISLYYLGATVASAFRHYAGRGGGWKNRVYSETPAP
jgi:hopene-associated glycosyltransferase HpnB